MTEKRIRRSDQEWLALIQECRASGLSDRDWCREHSISINTFYNKISCLRKKACDIPKTQALSAGQRHEVVPLEIACEPAGGTADLTGGETPFPVPGATITVRMGGCSIEISNHASEEAIRGTILALGRLC